MLLTDTPLGKPVQGLSRQGLHATALEAAKLLLKLDPADPQGMLFCIDYFALRAQAYAWLVVRRSMQAACCAVHARGVTMRLQLIPQAGMSLDNGPGAAASASGRLRGPW